MHHRSRFDGRSFSWRQRALLRELHELEDLQATLDRTHRAIDAWADRFREAWSSHADALIVVTPTHLVAAPNASALRCRAVGVDERRCREPVWRPDPTSTAAAGGAVLFVDGPGRAAEALCRQLCGYHLEHESVVTVAPAETVVIPRAALAVGQLELVLGGRRTVAVPPVTGARSG